MSAPRRIRVKIGALVLHDAPPGAARAVAAAIERELGRLLAGGDAGTRAAGAALANRLAGTLGSGPARRGPVDAGVFQSATAAAAPGAAAAHAAATTDGARIGRSLYHAMTRRGGTSP